MEYPFNTNANLTAWGDPDYNYRNMQDLAAAVAAHPNTFSEQTRAMVAAIGQQAVPQVVHAGE